MSLLMDALKKAEQEKKEAAERQKNETDQGGSAEANENDTSAKPSAAGVDKKITEGLTLEPVNEDLTGTIENTISDELTDNNRKSSLNHIGETTFDPETPEVSETEELDLEQQLTDNKSGKEADMDILYENSREDSTSDHFYSNGDNRTSRTFVSAEQLIKDIGGGRDQPTPVSASTVFSARGYVPENQGKKWIIFALLCLVITVSFSALYYFSVTPSLYEFNSPSISEVADINPRVTVTPQSTESTEDFTEPQAEESEPEALVDGQDETVDYGLSIETATRDQDTETMESPVILPQATGGSGEHDDMDTDGDHIAEQEYEANEPEPVVDTGTQLTPDVGNQEISDIATGIEKIHISKSKSVDVHASIINKAYEEYLAGNYSLAESGYRQVLEKYPENRDALLGLAAIKYRNGDIQSAYHNYLEVLKFYPGDAAAQSALIGLNQNVDPVKAESTIKSLLQKQPETAHLYFTLGNLYAEQKNWMKAQRAFFDAFRIDSKNPDYALNLAISLDHIGQPQSALDYYQAALDLAATLPVGFNTGSVSARINRIKNNPYPE